MSAVDAATFFRNLEAAELDSTCTITAAGAVVFDPDTGVNSTTATVVYEGACQCRPLALTASDTVTGDDNVVTAGYLLKLPPAESVNVTSGHEVTIESSPDAGMVGRSFRVVEVEGDDWQVSRRVRLEAVTS